MATSTGLGILFVVAVVAALAAAKGTSLPDAVTGAAGAAASGVSALVYLLAEAIATAEGFYKSGSLAQRQNNPGNITDPSTGTIRTFGNVQDGWQALYDQINLMFSGSPKYNSGMSLAEIGDTYSNHDPNWANNVAAYMGVSTSTTLDELQAQYGG